MRAVEIYCNQNIKCMQQFISKVYNFIDLNRDNAYKNNILFLFGGESVQEYLNMSTIPTRFASSEHVSTTFKVRQLRPKYGNFVLSTATSFPIRPHSVLFEDA